MYLDGESLNFSYHVKEKKFKAMKGISIIRILNKALPQYGYKIKFKKIRFCI